MLSPKHKSKRVDIERAKADAPKGAIDTTEVPRKKKGMPPRVCEIWYLKPADGVSCPMGPGARLNPEGRWIAMDGGWLDVYMKRRIVEGSCVFASPPKAEKPKPAEQPKRVRKVRNNDD